MMEDHFRRAMQLARGDFTTFLNRPISGTVMTLTVLVLIWTVWSAIRQRQRIPVAES